MGDGINASLRQGDLHENGGMVVNGTETSANRMDLHAHSVYSDGDRTPAALVRCALGAGVSLLALTDHDCVDGVTQAVAAGKEAGLPVVPGVEMDNEFEQELHILGLCIDPNNAELRLELEAACERRIRRNARMLRQLADAGYEVTPFLPETTGVMSRLHVALALVRGGFAQSVQDAFTRFLRRGMPGYAVVTRPTPARVIEILRGAGGISVLAHPCHLKGNVHSVIQELCSLGLDGIEAYYPTSTPGQTSLFVSLAAQNNLLVTCGSDFHGDHRPAAKLGCAWTASPALERTRALLLERL